jgi:S-adenosylmethionine hydrolase
MARPLIALLTDFGLRDHYVAAMKGIALGICRDLTLVDITHDIPPQDILAATLELKGAYPCFPEGTVFLAVVDPGVGSARRALGLEAGGYRFVAPDNGLLTTVLEREKGWRAVELTEPRYQRPAVSRTFEGRDRFAPAAAWLACGLALADLGGEVHDPVRLEIPAPRIDASGITGEIIRVDRFGNLVTNIDRRAIDMLNAPAAVEIAGRQVLFTGSYSDVPAGSLCALIGSTGHLEVSVNGGNAAQLTGLGRRAALRVRRGA